MPFGILHGKVGEDDFFAGDFAVEFFQGIDDVLQVGVALLAAHGFVLVVQKGAFRHEDFGLENFRILLEAFAQAVAHETYQGLIDFTGNLYAGLAEFDDFSRRLSQEFFLEQGQTAKDATGYKKVLANPYVATAITVVLGVALGMTGYTKIWPLFGAANQLLAAIGLLAVCTWLGAVGKNNKMFYIPMVFMLAVTICSLIQTITAKLTAYTSGSADVWALIQALIAVLLVVLSVVLAVISAKTLLKQKSEKKNDESKVA